jgi:hypothetical protein
MQGKEYRTRNIEQGTSNKKAEVRRNSSFIIPCSLFDIRQRFQPCHHAHSNLNGIFVNIKNVECTPAVIPFVTGA